MAGRIIVHGENLSIGYPKGAGGRKVVHRHLYPRLEQGKMTCLLGPNGGGKSTLLRTLTGSQKPLCGQLFLDEVPLHKYSPKQLSKQIGVVLTDRTGAGGLKVEEIVSMGRYPYSGFFGALEASDKKIIDNALTAVGIRHKKEAYVAELSDGERQKAMIAKALAQECPLIVLDEPTAFLDVASRIEIMQLLRQLTFSGKTILLSTHDIEQALLLSDRLWLLSKEHGLISGTTEEIVSEGKLDLFFGKENISFDALTGNFRMETNGAQTIEVVSSDENFFWAKNALLRNGYSVNKKNTNDENRNFATLHVINHTELVLKQACRESRNFSTFDALIEYLKSIHE